MFDQVNEDEYFPADLILIHSKNIEDSNKTSEDDIGICYIETKNLDGETNLKYKEAQKEFTKMINNEKEFCELKGFLECTSPNEMINDFRAVYYSHDTMEDLAKIDSKSLLLRGCCLKQTKFIYGLAVYIGENTKIVQNFPKLKHKVASLE